MNSRDFCFWLQGYFEISDAKTMTDEQVEVLKNHLRLAFVHEIDPLRESQTPASVKELNNTHDGVVPSEVFPDGNGNIPSEIFPSGNICVNINGVDFCFWLQGYFEISGVTSLSEGELEIIKKKLDSTFIHDDMDEDEPKKNKKTKKDKNRFDYLQGGGEKARC